MITAMNIIGCSRKYVKAPNQGVVINSVTSGSVFESYLLPNDLILEANLNAIFSEQDLVDEFAKMRAKGSNRFLLLVKRNGKLIYIAQEIPAYKNPLNYLKLKEKTVLNQDFYKIQEPAEVALPPGPVIPSAASKTFGVGCYWAVVIGISSYKDSRIPALRYAARDAKEFYDWLISPNGGRHAPSCVKLLLNEDATARNIRTVLFSWLKQALKEDVVTIYFAGHGSPESPDSQENLFLFSYDTDYDVVASTAFPMWDLETALNRFITAEKVVIVMDACHAGGVGRSFDIARRDNRSIEVNPINTGLQGLSGISKGICVICASDEKQFSQEGIKWGGGHGVFTYFLLDGLSGAADYNHDRVVTLGELIQYISEKVRRATANAQSPVVSGSFDPALGYGMR